MPDQITSAADWRSTVSSNAVVVADFYADWCGPCKMIAPHFESLANKYAKPRKIAFVKVNVDNQGEVSQQYGVRAMPTFLILHNGSVIKTIQGANPPALTSAVEAAIKLAGPGAVGGSSFTSGGQRLGGTPVGGQRVGSGQRVARPISWDINQWVNAILSFLGLYFVSLFSLDPYKSAEASKYNKKNPPPQAKPATGPGGKPAGRATFKTLNDLGSE
ncbi:thioredoxin-like protein [Cercophora samala]|uniref:Thioredoxin-like protein n=1 Tax=Cercophora samala TaxID=330535 RepID=A0AA40DCE0_9PEZI|nr:thioredoxin-like protein [Cercophora samala]